MVTLADAAAVAQRVDPERAAEAMALVSGTGRQALGDMRRMLGLLRGGPQGAGDESRDQPDTDDRAPQPGLAELGVLAERVRSTGLEVRIESSGEPFALSEAAGLTVYRIVQESLTNALKHAPSARWVRVSLAFDDPEVRVLITDNGRSVPWHRAKVSSAPGAGHGLLGMRERAAAFGGMLVAGPQTRGGWQVAATLRGCKAPTPP
jgi:signal transduction histidine kinase